eukprot:scaffold685_cov281-Pinguiococcus_pyrenoidosus.AAC.6
MALLALADLWDRLVVRLACVPVWQVAQILEARYRRPLVQAQHGYGRRIRHPRWKRIPQGINVQRGRRSVVRHGASRHALRSLDPANYVCFRMSSASAKFRGRKRVGASTRTKLATCRKTEAGEACSSALEPDAAIYTCLMDDAKHSLTHLTRIAMLCVDRNRSMPIGGSRVPQLTKTDVHWSLF